MKKTPCEFILWNLIPVLRSEIARSMVNDLGLTQKEAAEKLEITPAAVCMYLSDKRGNAEISDKDLVNEIKISAKNILNDDNIGLVDETCRLCKFVKFKGLFPFLNSEIFDSKRALILCKF